MTHVELIWLGDSIKSSRRLLKLSQEDLAERCDLHRTYICDVERGSRNVSFMTLLKIAQGLGTTLARLTESLESAKYQPAIPIVQRETTVRVGQGRSLINALPARARAS